MSYNQDLQEILLMQDLPEVQRNASEPSSTIENLVPSQTNDSINSHHQILSTHQIQEHSKMQNFIQNQNNVDECVISENQTEQKNEERLKSLIEQSKKRYFQVHQRFKHVVQTGQKCAEAKQKSPKRTNFIIACQKENKNLFSAKQPKKQNKVPKKAVQPVQEQKQTHDQEFIIRATQKFDQFFRKCKSSSDQFTCLAGHQAKCVCLSKQCASQAYICDTDNCQLRKKHQNCILQLDIQLFSGQLNKNLQRQREISLQLFLFEQQIIQKISQNRTKLTKLLPFQGMNCDELIQCLNDKNKTNLSLIGSDILSIFDEFHKETNYDLQRLKLLRKELTQKRKIVKDVVQNPIKMTLKKFNKEELIKMPSKLIQNKSEIKFVLEELNYPRELKLLFRASQHQFNLSKYHKVCDDAEHTLTIIKTEHQKFIGAYTPLELGSKIGRDKTNKTFLLAINLQEKLQHIHNGQCAIYYNQQFGPCFGGLYQQRDIEIYQQKGILYCKTSFPNAYNWKRHFFSSQESWRFLTGVTEGKICRVMDFEVFKVYFRE